MNQAAQAKSRMINHSQGGGKGGQTHDTFTTVIADRISTPTKSKVPCGISVNSNSSVQMFASAANSALNKQGVDSVVPGGSSTQFGEQGSGWAN